MYINNLNIDISVLPTLFGTGRDEPPHESK